MTKLKNIILFALVFCAFFVGFKKTDPPFVKSVLVTDSLPLVLATNHADLIESRLRHEAVLNYVKHQLPTCIKEWEVYKKDLRKKIIERAGVVVNHTLPLDILETGSVHLNGYKIKNIAFQTRPGVYATANLYLPDGKGPFPAVITMHGHWPAGRLYESFQAIAQTAALNGYVCLNIDATGAGERTSVHGTDEYHGANLGASLMNVGETLMGMQVSDNMRGVDLLTSLPYVDAGKIGATGASGGGNQTMWLTALDDRIKAAVPVVSVGTFESYIMRSNCVCELMPDGFALTEEAGIIALAAPRAIKMCNIIHDNPTFLSSEMLRSYTNARQVYQLMGAENNISNLVLDKTHGYWPENREAMLGWFDLHLKGNGSGLPKKEIPFTTLPNEQLMVFAKGKRDVKVEGIATYLKRRGKELRTVYLETKTFNAVQKIIELREILRIHEPSRLQAAQHYAPMGGWDRIALETTDGKLIPLLHTAPANKPLGYIILCNTGGKNNIAPDLIKSYKNKGLGIVLVDLSGTGEVSSEKENKKDRSMAFHTQSRAELWLGKTMIGEWVKELKVVHDFLLSEYQPKKIGFDGNKEAGLAAMFMAAVENKADYLVLREMPVSYQYDKRPEVDFFTMAIHLPEFLKWGDVSLAAGLTGKKIKIITPVTMSGQKIEGNKLKEYEAEFERVKKMLGKTGDTVFN